MTLLWVALRDLNVNWLNTGLDGDATGRRKRGKTQMALLQGCVRWHCRLSVGPTGTGDACVRIAWTPVVAKRCRRGVSLECAGVRNSASNDADARLATDVAARPGRYACCRTARKRLP